MIKRGGIYEHYKGGLYRVMDIATHTEREETLVIYRNADGEVFARPYDMFFGEVDGVPRFKYVMD